MMDKPLFSGVMALFMVFLAIWVVIRDYRKRPKSKGLMFFPRKRGGFRTEDVLGFMDTVSIEVRRTIGAKNEHSQSYKCKEPIITSGKDWYRTEGLLESKTLGVIPAYFDILFSIHHIHVTIDFKLTCLDNIPDVEMVKAWAWLNADGYSISGGDTHPLLPASSVWEKVFEGFLNHVRFINENGELLLWSRESTSLEYDRIWKHKDHAEYVTMWIHRPEGFTLKKGTIYECTWKLRYEGKENATYED